MYLEGKPSSNTLDGHLFSRGSVSQKDPPSNDCFWSFVLKGIPLSNPGFISFTFDLVEVCVFSFINSFIFITFLDFLFVYLSQSSHLESLVFETLLNTSHVRDTILDEYADERGIRRGRNLLSYPFAFVLIRSNTLFGYEIMR